MESNNIHINAIVWAVDSNKAIEVAQKFSNGTFGENGAFNFYSNEYNLSAYTRGPSQLLGAAPRGITDVIIIYVNESSEALEAKKYLDTRKGIPIRVLTSENFLTEESQLLDCKFVGVSEITGEGRESVIKEARKFEETLLNCFNKFDINGNGLISVDELIKVSAELGHDLQLDDAKMIADSLDETKSNSGNITFNGFKKWWVTGKSDFTAFRRLCKAEMSVNNLVKLTSRHFNNYLTNLKSESKSVSEQEISQKIDLNIHSNQQFENGIGLYVQLCSGNDAKDVIDSHSDIVRNSPVSLIFKIEFDSNESAMGVVEILNSAIKPMLNAVDQVSQILGMGGDLNFRTSQNFVVAEVTVSGLIADMLTGQVSMFNLEELNASGAATVHLFTALTISHLLNDSFWTILENAVFSKFHLNSKSFNFRNAISSLVTTLEAQVESGNLPSSLRNSFNFFKASGMLRSFTLDLAFDSIDVNEKFINFAVFADGYKKSEETLEQARERLINDPEFELQREINQLREKINEFKEQAQEMKQMIPEEFTPIIKSVNLEKFDLEVIVNVNSSKILLKTTLNLPGLNSLRNEVFA